MAKLCLNGHEVKDTLRFCPICGAELQEEVMKFCKKCGNERRGTEKFCSKCGTPFGNAPTNGRIKIKEEADKTFKKNLPYIIGATVIIALSIGGWWLLKGERANGALETTLVYFKKTAPSDNLDVTAEISIDYPQKGNPKLKDNVIDFILKALKEDFTFEELSQNPTYEGDKYDGQAVVVFYGEAKLKEFKKEGVGEVTLNIRKETETDKYLSYIFDMGGSAGGTGIGLYYGVSFDKADGSTIQVIRDSNEDKFKAELISSVKEHLSKNGGLELLDESELKTHPYPKKAPYLSKDGICFIYQKYEIGAGVMGEVEFVIPYSKMQSYMSEKALSLVDVNANIEQDKEDVDDSVSAKEQITKRLEEIFGNR